MNRIEYIYTCSKCGKHELEECTNGVTIVQTISAIDEDGELIYGSAGENMGGEETYYCCKECGNPLPEEINSAERLVEYFQGLTKKGS